MTKIIERIDRSMKGVCDYGYHRMAGRKPKCGGQGFEVILGYIVRLAWVT